MAKGQIETSKTPTFFIPTPELKTYTSDKSSTTEKATVLVKDYVAVLVKNGYLHLNKWRINLENHSEIAIKSLNQAEKDFFEAAELDFDVLGDLARYADNILLAGDFIQATKCYEIIAYFCLKTGILHLKKHPEKEHNEIAKKLLEKAKNFFLEAARIRPVILHHLAQHADHIFKKGDFLMAVKSYKIFLDNMEILPLNNRHFIKLKKTYAHRLIAAEARLKPSTAMPPTSFKLTTTPQITSFSGVEDPFHETGALNPKGRVEDMKKSVVPALSTWSILSTWSTPIPTLTPALAEAPADRNTESLSESDNASFLTQPHKPG